MVRSTTSPELPPGVEAGDRAGIALRKLQHTRAGERGGLVEGAEKIGGGVVGNLNIARTIETGGAAGGEQAAVVFDSAIVGD